MAKLALFLGIVLNLALYIIGAGLAGWHPVQTMVALALLNFVAILIHELGHAWSYRHVGGQVHQIAVLFAVYDFGQCRLRRSRLSVDGDVGGYVVGSFRPAGPTIRDQIIVSSAGSAANFVTGVAAAVVGQFLSPPELGSMTTEPEPAVAGPLPLVDPAGLPAPDMISISIDAVDAYHNALWWYQLSYAVLVLFATLSIGLALLNLLPYGGSDGQKILQALKLQRAMRAR